MAGPGVIAALAGEARCFLVLPHAERPAVRTVGVGPAGVAQAVAELAAAGAEGIVSFGVAGGLHPELAAGTLVIAEQAVDARATERLEADRVWRNRIAAALGGAVPWRIGAIAMAEHILAGPADKRRLHEASGALAVDMESLAVARAAAAHGLPFAALRAITDPATRALPAWLGEAVRPDGGLAVGTLMGRLLLRPATLGALIGMARDHRRALGSLRRVCLVLGPGLALG